MKLLILGITGAMGTALEFVCKKRNLDYIGLSHKDIDITDKESLVHKIKESHPDVIINMAAFLGIDDCESSPNLAYGINSIAVRDLSEICKNEGILLVHASTVAVFDGMRDTPYTEDDIPNPINTYGVSKFAGECYVKNICEKYYIIRFPLLFGMRRNTHPGFVDKALQWINGKDDVYVASDKIDSPTYTIDAANILLDIINDKKPYGIYHIHNNGIASYYELVEEIVKILGIKVNLHMAKDSDFKNLGLKTLRNGMKSVKLEKNRDWKKALLEYLGEYKK